MSVCHIRLRGVALMPKWDDARLASVAWQRRDSRHRLRGTDGVFVKSGHGNGAEHVQDLAAIKMMSSTRLRIRTFEPTSRSESSKITASSNYFVGWSGRSSWKSSVSGSDMSDAKIRGTSPHDLVCVDLLVFRLSRTTHRETAHERLRTGCETSRESG